MIASTVAQGQQELRRLTIGIQSSPAATLLMVAKEQDLFLEQGLDVQLVEFTAGKFAMQAFLAGSLDAVVSGELPVLLASLQERSFQVITEVVANSKNETRLIARKTSPTDNSSNYFLSKKRVLSTSFGGGPEYFTYLALQALKVTSDQVTIINQKPEDMPAAIASGSVDLISIFDPFATFAEKLLKQQAIEFPLQLNYRQHYLLSLANKSLAEDSNIALLLLRALTKAGDYIKTNPSQSQHILKKYTKLSLEVIKNLWGNFEFYPALTSDLQTTWKDQLQWLQTKKQMQPTKNYDQSLLINPKYLVQVKAETTSTLK